MTFDELLTQVKELLQREKRVSYRGLKRRFAVDDEYLEDLKEELIGAQQVAADEDGRFLVWLGRQGILSTSPHPPPVEQSVVEAERRPDQRPGDARAPYRRPAQGGVEIAVADSGEKFLRLDGLDVKCDRVRQQKQRQAILLGQCIIDARKGGPDAT
jgi:hypothetical protein